MEKYVIVGGGVKNKYYAVIPSTHSRDGNLWWWRADDGHYTTEEATKFDTYEQACNVLLMQKQAWGNYKGPVWVESPRVEKVSVDAETHEMISKPVEGYVIKYDNGAGAEPEYAIVQDDMGTCAWTNDLEEATTYIDETAAKEAWFDIMHFSAIAHHRFCSIERINREKMDESKVKEENTTPEYNEIFARINSTNTDTDDIRFMVIVKSENVYYIKRDHNALNDLQFILNYYSSHKIRVFEMQEKEVSIKVEIKDKHPTTCD